MLYFGVLPHLREGRKASIKKRPPSHLEMILLTPFALVQSLCVLGGELSDGRNPCLRADEQEHDGEFMKNGDSVDRQKGRRGGQ